MDYTSALNFVYGDNPIYQVRQSSNGREKGLYENADIYVSISICSNEEDAKSKKEYKEFSNAFAGKKHEEATIEEFLNYKSITITSSKRLLPINPDIYMNYADKQRMKEVNESNNLINKALESN